jgi:hypothetical protein
MEFFLERINTEQPDCTADTVFGTNAESKTMRPLVVHFEMVPSRFPPELLTMLSRFPPGSLRLEIGIQTLNSETAALIKRPGDGEVSSFQSEALEVLRFLRQKTNAIVHADLIAGLPGEGIASFGAGFDRLWLALSVPDAMEKLQIPPVKKPAIRAEIQLGILKCLPGTPISRHTVTSGMRYNALPPYEVQSTAALPAIDLDRIKNFARFWELIVNRGTFPDFAAAVFPGGKPVFRQFMDLSDRLFARFGRNWGIDRADLRMVLEEETP